MELPSLKTLVCAATLSSATIWGNAAAQDITRLPGRADIWLFSQENEPATTHQWKWVLRFTQPFRLPDDWRVSLRADLPLLYTDKSGSANPDGDYKAHIGDMLGQIIFTTPRIAPGITANIGARVQFPTGGESPFGSSQYKLGPQAGFTWILADVASGFGVALDPLVRYYYGVHPTEPKITTTREIDLYPEIRFEFPEAWTIALWQENPIVYNKRAGTWFVPFDIMVTKKIDNRFEVGAGAAVRLTGEDPNYKYIIYGRVSAYF